MAAFELNEQIKPTTFLLNRSDIVGRLDVYFNYSLKNSVLKSSYQTASINSLFKTYSGGTPDKANLSFWQGNIPWASPKDFRAFTLNDTEDHISTEAIKNSATSLVSANTLLMVVRSGVLQHTIPVAITSKPMAFNQDVKAFIAHGNVSVAFLAVYFRIYNDQILPLLVKHSTTVQSINTAELNVLKIPVLPHELQQQVVDVYQKYLNLRDQKEKQAQNLLAEIENYLLEELEITLPHQDNRLEKRIFTIPFSKVTGERINAEFYINEHQLLVDNIYAKQHYRLRDIVIFSSETWNQQDYFSDIFPYIEISEIDLSLGEIRNIKEISIKEAPSRAKMIVRKGDILISMTRPTRGAIAYNQLDGIQIASTGFAIIRDLKTNFFSKEFLFHVLRLSITLRQMGQRSSGGNYPAITQEELGNVVIPFVDNKRQIKIVKHISQIRAQAQQLQTEAEQLLKEARIKIERLILG